MGRIYRRGVEHANAGMDCVPLSRDLWQRNAIRLRLNCGPDGAEGLKFYVGSPTTASCLAPDESVQDEEEEGYKRTVTVQWLKLYFEETFRTFSERSQDLILT